MEWLFSCPVADLPKRSQKRNQYITGEDRTPESRALDGRQADLTLLERIREAGQPRRVPPSSLPPASPRPLKNPN